jgi:lipopolysaccharide export system protein LptA
MGPVGRLCSVGGLALVSICPAFAVSPPAPLPTPAIMRIQADVVELDLNRQTTHAYGKARLSYDRMELEADQVTADGLTGEMQASGHLALVDRGRRLEGESLSYNYRQDQGVLQHARAREQGVVIRGESIEFSSQRLVAHHAYFTTCDKEQPDYSLGADLISLTAAEAAPGKRPESGRLTLDRARVIYHGRRLLTLPRYSVSVGQIGQAGASPFPASGFDRDDGPYAQISYSLGRPQSPTVAGLSYRLTSFRGIRGYLKLGRTAGPLELGAAYVRREASSDRELRGDEFTTHLADVMVNRAPEFRAALPGFSLTPALRLRAELLTGSYSESQLLKSETRARADRTSLSSVLAINPYPVSRHLRLGHALGWQGSSYSSGDRLDIRFLQHSLEFAPGHGTRLSLSYIARHGSGETPFLFDRIEVGRELLGEARLRLGPHWRLRLADLYDLQQHDSRDIILALTRTIHCLDYTVGWRKTRGALFVGISITPPSADGRDYERAGAPAPDSRVPAFGKD